MRALITGVTGQDGSYLAELLLGKGYEVHGLKRRVSSFNSDRVDHLYEDLYSEAARFFLHHADLTDGGSLAALLHDLRPDEVSSPIPTSSSTTSCGVRNTCIEIYNLGAQSHVKVIFEAPEYIGDTDGIGPIRLLEAIRLTRLNCRFYQASSSEMFGSTSPPHSETSVFHPGSPYACAKLFAHSFTVNYRGSYGLHASCGILFNHESPRRGETFVTRKITRAVARIKLGLEEKVYLGNLDARRDWGYAPDYVRAMWLMLQQDEPDDYVIGTGEAHSVGEFVETAFACAGLDWHDHVEIDARYFRPAEVDNLLADASKARRVLGWEPCVTFSELVRIMVHADLCELERTLKGGVPALSARFSTSEEQPYGGPLARVNCSRRTHAAD